jgi:hypothetical protein
MTPICRCISGLLASLAVCGQAAAAESCGAAALQDRSLLAAAYLFVPDITGSASLGPVNANLTLSGGDLIGGAKSGFMGYLRRNQGDHFVYAEAISMHFKKRSFEPFFGLAVNSSLRFLELGAGQDFRFADGAVRMSAYAGARHLGIDLAANGTALNAEVGERGLDATLGASAEAQLSERWVMALKADAAGLGLSRRDYWSGALLLVRNVGEHSQLFGGWRMAEFRSDASPSGLALELHGRGPQFGFSYRR